jgi:hypothetical protein
VDLTSDRKCHYEVADLDVLEFDQSSEHGRDFVRQDLPIAGQQASVERCDGEACH